MVLLQYYIFAIEINKKNNILSVKLKSRNITFKNTLLYRNICSISLQPIKIIKFLEILLNFTQRFLV